MTKPMMSTSSVPAALTATSPSQSSPPSPASTPSAATPASPAKQAAPATPFYVELQRGRSVLWCRCGRSRQQPYCDGSHAGTTIMPMRYTAPEAEEVLLCGCKQTGTPPFCDGAHNALAGAYASDDPESDSNRRVRPAGPPAAGKVFVDGGCFVCTVDDLPWQAGDGFAWAEPVSRRDGARHQALFCIDVEPDAAPVLDFGDRQVALLFPDGQAEFSVGTRSFGIAAGPGAEVGACVLPGEAFRVTNTGNRRSRFFAAVGPIGDAAGAEMPRWPSVLPARFDDGHPLRLAPVDPIQRKAMGDRFFQVLVSKAHGATSLTQFIGEIPPGKSMPHRHLYEETLIVLAGQGRMWTETLNAPVSAGDVIFLPRKQLHSLQCTGERPMLLAGVIHPGDNPSINYY